MNFTKKELEELEQDIKNEKIREYVQEYEGGEEDE